MKLVKRMVRIVYSIYAFMLFVLLMLIVFPFAVVASFWGRMRGGDFIYQMSARWADIWYFLIGIRHRNLFQGDPTNGKQYIFVANHISYLDIPSIVKTLRHHRIRALGKYEMKKIPVFGYIYRIAVVMVDRSDANDRAQSVRVLKSILNKGVSIFIFPEGTFNETGRPLKDFYDGAFRIAIETQIPIRPILFLDTYDRLNYKSIFSLSPGPSRALFLNEVSVEGLSTEDLPVLKKTVHQQMESVLNQYRVSWIAH